MKHILILTIFLFWAHLQSQELDSVETIDIASITVRIDDYVKKNNIPALMVAIVENGKVTYIKRGNTKRKNGLPISEKSVFQIASISKTFTAIIANTLLDQGLLELKAPISKYLKEDVSSEVLRRLNGITIKDLLHHRAGFPHDGKSLPPSPNGTPQKKPYTKALLLKDLANMKVNAKAEKRFSYSNFGYALLGHIMEKVSGKPYAVLLQEYVNQPCGLENTTVVEKDVPVDLLAIPYATHKRELELRPWVTGTTKASGGIFSSGEDLIRIMEAQMRDYKIHQATGAISPLLLTLQKEKVSGALSYGFGMFESRKGGKKNILTLGHGGDLDGYGSFYDFYPDLDLGLIMLTSSGGKAFIDFHDQLERFLLGLPQKKEIRLPKHVLKRYEGTFAFESGREIKIKLKGDNLISTGKRIPPLQLHAQDENTFFFKEFDGWHTFEFNAKDEIIEANYIQYGEIMKLRKIK